MTIHRDFIAICIGAIGGDTREKLEALFKTRDLVCSDETLRGTDERNQHPAFRSLIQSMNITVPNLSDYDDVEKTEMRGVDMASNAVGVIASLRSYVETHCGSYRDDDFRRDPIIRVVVEKLRSLARVA
jgi:hypothetical protein